jgi:hypothetical protein
MRACLARVRDTAEVPAIAVATSTLRAITNAGFCWRKMNIKETTTRDQDIHKGATEDERPSGATNAPALDANGLPNDEKRIAEDSVGAREDGTQG